MPRNSVATLSKPSLLESADALLDQHAAHHKDRQSARTDLSAVEIELARALQNQTYDQIMAHVVSEYRDMTAARKKGLTA